MITAIDAVAKWTGQWRYDFWWRNKYNIPFGSEAHRAVSQVDIYFEYVENRMFQETLEKFKVTEEKEKKYKDTGIWLNPNEEMTDDDWDKLSLSSLSKNNMK